MLYLLMHLIKRADMFEEITLKAKSLLYLRAINDKRTYTAAAQELGVEVKTMRKHLDLMEQKLEGKLIDVDKKNIRLSSLGQQFCATNLPILDDLNRSMSKTDTRKTDTIRMLLPIGSMRIFLADQAEHQENNPNLIFENATYSGFMLEEYVCFIKQLFEHYDIVALPSDKLHLLGVNDWIKIFHYESKLRILAPIQYLDDINIKADDIRNNIDLLKQLNFIVLVNKDRFTLRCKFNGKECLIPIKSNLLVDSPEYQIQALKNGTGVAVVRDSISVTHGDLGVVDVTPEGMDLGVLSVHHLMNANYPDKYKFKLYFRNYVKNKYSNAVNIF
jgi:DNA-binding transcriptional LysR family regulator